MNLRQSRLLVVVLKVDHDSGAIRHFDQASDAVQRRPPPKVDLPEMIPAMPDDPTTPDLLCEPDIGLQIGIDGFGHDGDVFGIVDGRDRMHSHLHPRRIEELSNLPHPRSIERGQGIGRTGRH